MPRFKANSALRLPTAPIIPPIDQNKQACSATSSTSSASAGAVRPDSQSNFPRAQFVPKEKKKPRPLKLTATVSTDQPFEQDPINQRVQEIPHDNMAALSIQDHQEQSTPKPPTMPLSLEIQYGGALRSSKWLFIIGDHDAVAMANWDPRQCKLSHDDFPIVTPVLFSDSSFASVVLLECTCRRSETSQQLQCLRGYDETIPISMESINAMKASYCIHRSILDFLGVQLRGSMGEIVDVVEIEQHCTDPVLMWSVKTTSRSYGIVKRSKQGNFRCLTCSSKNCCQHVATFLDNREDFHIELPPRLPSEEQPSIISNATIHFIDGMLASYSRPAKGPFGPDMVSSSCVHGVHWSEEKIVAKTCIIYNVNGQPYTDGPVLLRKLAESCPDKCELRFNGHKEGLLNVNNRHLVEYQLLFNYMRHFARDGTTLSAFHDIQMSLNRDMLKETIPEDILYRAWSGFLSLVQIDESSGFECPSCKGHPPIVVLDGVALSCRKDLISTLLQPSTGAEVRPPLLRGITHEKRVFVTAQSTRLLLCQFATGKINRKKANMTVDDVNTLVSRIGKEFRGSALEQLIVRLTFGRLEADPPYSRLLKELSKNTPVSGLFQFGQFEDVAIQGLEAISLGQIDIADPRQADQVNNFRIWFPAVLECLVPIRRVCGELPADVRGVIAMLVARYRGMFDGFLPRSTNTDYGSIIAAESALSFFPSWPVVRGKGNYADNERSARDEADVCTKLRHGHPVLGPGIMVYLCPHGISYGFSVMDQYESPRMAFETFSSRYVPPNIVYDNACKLHLYCLKREPVLFRKSRFFVDRLHWKNHVACSIGYCMSNYKSDSSICSINSQVNEQLNSWLVKLRRSLSYMSYAKFIRSLKLFLYLRNRTLIAKLL